MLVRYLGADDDRIARLAGLAAPAVRATAPPTTARGGTVRSVEDDAVPDPGAQGDEADPFEGLTLDEDFVRGASLVEDSAEERLARLARIEAEHRRLAAEREVQRAALDKSLRRQARRGRRSGNEGRRRLIVIGVMVLVFAGLVTWNTRDGGEQAAIGTGGLFGDAPTGSVSGFGGPPLG